MYNVQCNMHVHIEYHVHVVQCSVMEHVPGPGLRTITAYVHVYVHVTTHAQCRKKLLAYVYDRNIDIPEFLWLHIIIRTIESEACSQLTAFQSVQLQYEPIIFYSASMSDSVNKTYSAKCMCLLLMQLSIAK